jgi:hypothetical protein
MSRTYSVRTCRCGKEVSANGAAWHSHMMGHVRKGEADFGWFTLEDLQAWARDEGPIPMKKPSKSAK